jgi:hypothetical protein
MRPLVQSYTNNTFNLKYAFQEYKELAMDLKVLFQKHRGLHKYHQGQKGNDAQNQGPLSRHLSKYSNYQAIVYVGCGERGNENSIQESL